MSVFDPSHQRRIEQSMRLAAREGCIAADEKTGRLQSSREERDALLAFLDCL